MSRAMQHIVSSSGTVVSRFLVSISFENDHSRDHIILIIIEIQITKKQFQIQWYVIMKLFRAINIYSFIQRIRKVIIWLMQSVEILLVKSCMFSIPKNNLKPVFYHENDDIQLANLLILNVLLFCTVCEKNDFFYFHFFFAFFRSRPD